MRSISGSSRKTTTKFCAQHNGPWPAACREANAKAKAAKAYGYRAGLTELTTSVLKNIKRRIGVILLERRKQEGNTKRLCCLVNPTTKCRYCDARLCESHDGKYYKGGHFNPAGSCRKKTRGLHDRDDRIPINRL